MIKSLTDGTEWSVLIYLNYLSKSWVAIYFYELYIIFISAVGERKSGFLRFCFKLRSNKAFLPSTESEAEVVATP